MININPFEVFPNLESLITDVKDSDKVALDWWNSLDPEKRSKWFDVYYVKNKNGLNLQEIVKLHNQQNNVVDEVKKKRARIINKKL